METNCRRNGRCLQIKRDKEFNQWGRESLWVHWGITPTFVSSLPRLCDSCNCARFHAERLSSFPEQAGMIFVKGLHSKLSSVTLFEKAGCWKNRTSSEQKNMHLLRSTLFEKASNFITFVSRTGKETKDHLNVSWQIE
ncbi:hypothetical protein TNIN_149181 [Trichonephila inaurata madagascariensis]|uniref:Uncharacterized protein n=1 Tax=Trichonephila inaurata madagascariensis TaxID=2747483 RepID=A0A8X6X7I0_9ARAC|nr:hypothetical protein TNIN_149181 [Trichonephila inaurata madagascariensis]